MSDHIVKESKNVKETKGVLIYGPYPKGQSSGAFNVSFPENPGRKTLGARDFEELVDVLKDELA
ncbi:MAG: hypothetical protein QME32_04635 [Endomicrobiia bacterium]|nr:hypothetical protein [Endomicrobiia bacterium]